ncbi:MAG: helix-turn-helix domain-containing protein [Pseudolysinimonas sp.]
MGEPGCPIARSVSVLDGKWTLLILRELFVDTRRFGELRAGLPGISPKTLADRLRAMEGQGIVHREVFPEIPPRVEYSLTPFGRTLSPVIEALREWGENWAQLAQPGSQSVSRERVALTTAH